MSYIGHLLSLKLKNPQLSLLFRGSCFPAVTAGQCVFVCVCARLCVSALVCMPARLQLSPNYFYIYGVAVVLTYCISAGKPSSC